MKKVTTLFSSGMRYASLMTALEPYDFLPLKYPILPEKSETISICNFF